MAVNPVDAMTWKARELKISYGILLTQDVYKRQGHHGAVIADASHRHWKR